MEGSLRRGTDSSNGETPRQIAFKAQGSRTFRALGLRVYGFGGFGALMESQDVALGCRACRETGS